jgi:secreted trypsin-like serine protease
MSVPFFIILALFLSTVDAKFKSNSKIVGGTEARENAFPYTAALFYYEDNIYGCGGAIIHQNFVLTAGHCFEDAEAKDVRVLVGTNSLKNGTDFRQVAEVILHDR